MSDSAQGPGWWQASDGQWYPPPGAASTFPPPSVYGSSPPPAYVPGAPSGPKTNGLAIASLVCSLGGIFGGLITCGLLAPAVIVGIVLGHVALSQLKNDPSQQGRGLAMGGVISGWVVVGLSLAGIIIVVISSAASST